MSWVRRVSWVRRLSQPHSPAEHTCASPCPALKLTVVVACHSSNIAAAAAAPSSWAQRAERLSSISVARSACVTGADAGAAGYGKWKCLMALTSALAGLVGALGAVPAEKHLEGASEHRHSPSHPARCAEAADLATQAPTSSVPHHAARHLRAVKGAAALASQQRSEDSGP